MLRLQRVEISGFKSFYEKVDLSFPGSVTAVVGPNGCGKSNIVDAIRWCMGEQSAKHLRGRAMEDVIFNGSESRGPAGMAEVTLPDLGADEIAVVMLTRTRRDGSGEQIRWQTEGRKFELGNRRRELRLEPETSTVRLFNARSVPERVCVAAAVFGPAP